MAHKSKGPPKKPPKLMADGITPINKAEEYFEGFIANKKILVADASPGVRSGIMMVLKELGARSANVVLCNNFSTAMEEIARVKPHIVICDYNLENHCGIRLLNKQHEFVENASERMSILVTANSRESSIAEAAEEDADAYILKPFTLQLLKDYLLRAVVTKVRPTPYQQALTEGKAKLTLGLVDAAQLSFKRAIGLAPAPALAHYYYGKTCMIQTLLDEAEVNYREGLKFNDLHYRCLSGLFDLLISQKRDLAAYDVATRMMMYFPISPKRLDEMLRLTVRARIFEKVELCLQSYSEMDYRPASLTRSMAAALTVAGIFYLANPHHNSNHPVELFQRALILAGKTPMVFREIITHLLRYKRVTDAQEFLRQYPAEGQADPTYLVLEYFVYDALAPAPRSVEAGRKILGRGIDDESIYEILIPRTLEVGHVHEAEDLAYMASKKFPNSKQKFLGMLPEEVRAAKALKPL